MSLKYVWAYLCYKPIDMTPKTDSRFKERVAQVELLISQQKIEPLNQNLTGNITTVPLNYRINSIG